MEFIYKNSSLVPRAELLKIQKKAKKYVSYLDHVADDKNYQHAESSMNLIFDTEYITEVLQKAENLQTKKLKYIVVIGVGGSNLGTKAMYDAISGYDDVLRPKDFPKMIFVDTSNTAILDEMEYLLLNEIDSPDEIVVVTISKSGTTTETIANTEIIMDIFEKRFGKKTRDRFVVITFFASKLWESAKVKGVNLLDIPCNVGGRFSVFSAVGLFPLAVAGFDVKHIIEGARYMRNKCLQGSIDKNPALMSAAILYYHIKKKKSIHDNFLFHSELESLGKWYRQLTGESLGKEKNLKGKVVHAGITPTVSIGSTDLHSVGQLNLGGPRDKVTSFIYSAHEPESIKVPEKLFRGLVDNIKGKTTGEILNAILTGTTIAYKKKKLPFMEIVLHDISERALGEFMQYKMMEIMILASLLQVNAFDQPHVELYKAETRKLLKKQ